MKMTEILNKKQIETYPHEPKYVGIFDSVVKTGIN